MSEFKPPKYDFTTKQWYVEEIDPRTDRRVATHDFYDKGDAEQFYLENDILWEYKKYI